MAEVKEDRQNWEEKACKTFSVERREDFIVLVLAGVTVALVWTGIIGPTFFKSLFF